jgi:hypothetical protein
MIDEMYLQMLGRAGERQREQTAVFGLTHNLAGSRTRRCARWWWGRRAPEAQHPFPALRSPLCAKELLGKANSMTDKTDR